MVGIVIIGRNEGERLRRCLAALQGLEHAVVYSDSGSSDGSVPLAREWGAAIVELSPELAFTAARGRNEGLARLMQIAPQTRYVQFIDGDCEIFPAWLLLAEKFLHDHPDAAVVCGRLRERFPERSVYNRLCDAEWNRAPGEVLACGGIAMMRTDAFCKAGGFRIDLPAGEEPELCHRLRAAGWRIHRLPDAMAWHDADMTRFEQWWARSRRNGFGYAQALADADPVESHHVRTAASAWIWAAAIPALLLVLLLLIGPVSLWAWSIYLAQTLRLAAKAEGSWQHRLERAGFLLLGRFPEMAGQLRYAWRRWRTRAQGTPLFDKA